ncbi:hypothetical protein LTR15_006441 [Elasticomyces elasticus]|nr:hypothetical protein LTR15_006441 [Elasticomyces elasticus]
MATEAGNTLPAAEDLATVLQEILGSSHRADPAQRKLLHDQACIFIQSIRPFRFLDLPRELRDVIYTHALMADGPLLVAGPCRHNDWPTAAQPALTQTSRQVRVESLPVFYGDNIFEAHVPNLDFGFFLSYMQGLGPQNVSYMREMSLTSVIAGWFGRVNCAVGTFEFVRWCATAHGIKDLNLRRGPLAEHDQLILDMVSVALESRVKGETSEPRLRAAFGTWLVDRDMTCRCGDRAGTWSDGVRICSNRKILDAEELSFCNVHSTYD